MPACALCNKEATLRRSHIIPAFVFRYMRETSATGFLRLGTNPLRRAQDGLKIPLLCDSCEQSFSRMERQFANDMFYPTQRQGVPEVEYGAWFLRFCVSISWRVLWYLSQDIKVSHLNERQVVRSQQALEIWGRFLRGEEKHPGVFEQRVILLEPIQTASSGLRMQPNTNRYLLRGLDLDLASSDRTAFSYAKLGPLALFGMIEWEDRWKGTKVNANEGTVGPKSYELSIGIFDYWMDRAKRMSNISTAIPTNQQEKLEVDIQRNPSRFISSKTFEAMQHDIRMFGSRAFLPGKGEGPSKA